LLPLSDDAIVVGLIDAARSGHAIRSSSDPGKTMATRSLPERVSALEEAVSALQRVPRELAAFRADVTARFDQVNSRFERIDAQFEQVYSQMRMLHEDLIDRIKTLGERRDAGATAPPRPPRPKRKR
jgi:hypothetical protein